MNGTFPVPATLPAQQARTSGPLPRTHPGVSNTVGSESRLMSPSHRGLAVSAACLATLLLVGQSCRRLAPPSLGHETRASLGTVGVYSVGPSLDASLSGPVGIGPQSLKVVFPRSGEHLS